MSLSQAKLFQNNMQCFCATLGDPKVIEQIQEETKEGDIVERKIQFYKGDRFVRFAIRFLCQWSALVYVCGKYVKDSDHTRVSVLEHINVSHNAEEARKLIEPLKKKLQDKLTVDVVQIYLNIDAYNGKATKVEAMAKEYQQLDYTSIARQHFLGLFSSSPHLRLLSSVGILSLMVFGVHSTSYMHSAPSLVE